MFLLAFDHRGVHLRGAVLELLRGDGHEIVDLGTDTDAVRIDYPDKAKEIAKAIRDEGPKGVQAQIQGDQLRVSGKKRDDLQAVQQLLKSKDFEIALQFDNYR